MALIMRDPRVERIRERFADELEDRFTKPNEGYRIHHLDPQKVREGWPINVGEESTRGLLIRLGQEEKLTVDDIDEICRRFLKGCVCKVGDPCDYHAATCHICLDRCKGHPTP